MCSEKKKKKKERGGGVKNHKLCFSNGIGGLPLTGEPLWRIVISVKMDHK